MVLIMVIDAGLTKYLKIIFVVNTHRNVIFKFKYANTWISFNSIYVSVKLKL